MSNPTWHNGRGEGPMTYTDDDVTAGARALRDVVCGHGLTACRNCEARAVLAAVAPAIVARALREAADERRMGAL